MRGTLIGSDYLKQGNGVKFLETNTAIAIHPYAAPWLDIEPLIALLTGSNITSFHFIHNGIEGSSIPKHDAAEEYVFAQRISSSCAQHNISYTEHVVPQNSLTVPYIEDADHKFILRQSYDNTAIIDSNYAADNFSFFDLMSGSSYSPQTHFSSSQDDLVLNDFSTLSYNDHPNAIIKARYPHYNSSIYPQIIKYNNTSSTSADIQQLKDNLPEGYLTQEFINDPQNIISGSWSVLRGVDILYGDNLDILHLGGYATTSYIPLSFSPISYSGSSSSILDQKSRIKYSSKAFMSTQATFFHTDAETMILKSDNTLVSASGIEVGDEIKTVVFELEEGNELSGSVITQTDNFPEHYGYINNITGSIQYVTSSLSTLQEKNGDQIFIEFTFEDGSTILDSPRSSYLIEESGSNLTYFEYTNFYVPGDKICYLDIDTNQITTKEITSKSLTWGETSEHIYNFDFEPYNYFLVNKTGSVYAISHNACNYCGYGWAPCGNYWCDSGCPSCESGEK